MTLTRKETRAVTSTSTIKDILQSDNKSVAKSEEVKEDGENLDSEKCKGDIT